MPELRLPRRLETVSAVCDRAEALVLAAGWSPADVLRVSLALGEAVGNAIEHGGEDDDVHISLALDGPTLSVRVDDGGPGPSPERLAAAGLPDDPLATSGRGLFILQRLADEVRVAEGGLCLTIRSRD